MHCEELSEQCQDNFLTIVSSKIQVIEILLIGVILLLAWANSVTGRSLFQFTE